MDDDIVVGNPIPPLNVCNAVQLFSVDKEAPPPLPPLPPIIHFAGIELSGKETVPPETVKPLEKVCKAVHVLAVDKDAPAVILDIG